MSGREIFQGFQGSGKAQGAFNVFNAETVRGVVEGVLEGEEGRAYIQTSASTVASYGAEALAGMIGALIPQSERARFLLHLDHCLDMKLIEDCVRFGWDSVMIDASQFDLEENIRRTRAVVHLAGEQGVVVEGEIGKVGGPEDGFTAGETGDDESVSSDEVERFVVESGIDLVAIGVGTKHGFYEEGKCEVNVGLLQAVQERGLGVPFVLHGGSGIPLGQVRQAVAAGVRKINISTELKEAYAGACRAHLEGPDPHAVIAGVEGAVAEVRRVVSERRRAFEEMSPSLD